MMDEVNHLPSSPQEESSYHGENLKARVLEDDETIMSTRPGKVAFYEAAFHAGLRLRKRCNKLPILTYLEEQRFNKVLKKIGEGGFFPIMTILGSKAFRKCFGLNRRNMASSDGDNAEDKPVEGATLVVGDVGESHHSRDEHARAISKNIDLQKLTKMAKSSKAATPALAKLYESSELCPTRLICIYLAYVWEELAKLYMSYELCPIRLICIYLLDIWEELAKLYASSELYAR
ncbi:hypothetical protein Acr_16g0000620 [Actinidia rufa]|uniref:Uncharacterized protein n=1 Tax=Actinidia rufa TaxID=165716 RepID=A0A7J0FZT8_9ERIC|nr:hypothetical protein Acr_16g0000620 [Actinidia rufa]